VLQQMGEGGRIGQVVDGDDLDVRVVLDRAEDVAADPAESVDADAHDVPPWVWSPAMAGIIGRAGRRVNEFGLVFIYESMHIR